MLFGLVDHCAARISGVILRFTRELAEETAAARRRAGAETRSAQTYVGRRRLADGTCAPGSVSHATTDMLHVWFIDVPAGPFSEISGLDSTNLRAAVIEYLSSQT